MSGVTTGIVPCVRYHANEASVVDRLNRTTVYGVWDAAREIRFSTRDAASLEVTTGVEPGVVSWSADGKCKLASAATTPDQARPTLHVDTDPAVAFVAESCPMADDAVAFPSTGTAGAICFGLRPFPSLCPYDLRPATLRLEWGGGDARLDLNTDGAVLEARIAGATVALPATWMLSGRVARYTLAWRVTGGTVTLHVYGGPANGRTLSVASGSYSVSVAAGMPAGGIRLSGRWVHMYALRLWEPAPVDKTWAAAAAALHAEWPWQGTVCALAFDARHPENMSFLPAPHDTIIDDWRAQAPNTALWRFHSNFRGYAPNLTPRRILTPRMGVRMGVGHDMLLSPQIKGHNQSGVVVFSTVPRGERVSPQFFSLSLLSEWKGTDGDTCEIDVYAIDQYLYTEYGAVGWQSITGCTTPPDGDGGHICTMGWRIDDTVVHQWYATETGGIRTVTTASGTIKRDDIDDNREPDVSCYIMGFNVVIHETRIVCPAPSVNAWDAVVRSLDAQWSAPP